MIKLSPSQYATANQLLAALSRGSSFFIVSAEPGFGLPTCMEYVRSRYTKPSLIVADHPELSGLDLLDQLYHQLHIDIEFQGKKEIPRIAVEILSLRDISAIYLDSIGMFLSSPSARRRTVQQIKLILISFPAVNVIVSGLDSDVSYIFELCGCSSHFAQALSLKGFRDFNEYKIFFESILAEHPHTEFADVSLETLYHNTKGNLGDTFLRLFHPAHLYKGKK